MPSSPWRDSLLAAVVVALLALTLLGSAAGGCGPVCTLNFGVKADADIRQIMFALRDFANRNSGRYPNSLLALVEPDVFGYRYLNARSIPRDPWKNAYRYCPPPLLGMPPLVWSFGSDGEPSGGDDIASWKELE